jgi:hypothetical protein
VEQLGDGNCRNEKRFIRVVFEEPGQVKLLFFGGNQN